MSKSSLSYLDVGEQFEIPQLKNLFRGLTVLRQSPCSVLVRGQIRDFEKDPFVTKNTLMAASLAVESTGKTVKIIQTSDGRAEIEQKFETRGLQTVIGPQIVHSGRGRKPKHGPINFPNNTFKIKDLASELGLDYQTVMNSFMKVKDQYEVVGKVSSSGRGAPQKLFRRKR